MGFYAYYFDRDFTALADPTRRAIFERLPRVRSSSSAGCRIRRRRCGARSRKLC